MVTSTPSHGTRRYASMWPDASIDLLADWRAGRPELTVPVTGGGGRDRSDEELQRGQRPGPGEQSAAARMVQTPVSLAASGDRAAADARGAAAGAGRLRDAGNHLERVSTGHPGKSTGIRAPIVHEIRYDHPPGRCCAPRIAGVHATRGGFRTERHAAAARVRRFTRLNLQSTKCQDAKGTARN